MKLSKQIQNDLIYSMLEYHTLYPNFESKWVYIFLGTSYDWVKGELRYFDEPKFNKKEVYQKNLAELEAKIKSVKSDMKKYECPRDSIYIRRLIEAEKRRDDFTRLYKHLSLLVEDHNIDANVLRDVRWGDVNSSANLLHPPKDITDEWLHISSWFMATCVESIHFLNCNRYINGNLKWVKELLKGTKRINKIRKLRGLKELDFSKLKLSNRAKKLPVIPSVGGVPEIGDIVEYETRGKVETWRVCSWLCELEPHNDKNDWIGEILYDATQKIKGKKMRHCLPSEATHISVYSICGTVALISECKVVGRVNWSDKLLKDSRDSAIRLGVEGEAIF